jgi:tetratricopeptide (TPR) repeat protein
MQKLSWNQFKLFAFSLPLAIAIFASCPAAFGAADIAGPSLGSSGVSEDAQKLISNKKWAEAAVVLRAELAESAPAPAEKIAVLLSRALVFSGRREEALAVLSQTLSREKSAPLKRELIQKIRITAQVFLTNTDFQLHQDGVNLMMARKYRAAREKFDKALEQEPTNVANLIRVGQCMALGGDYDSAAERLRLAERLDPYEPEVRLWLGRALHQRGEIAEATEELKAAYDEQPGSEIAATWYAETLVSHGQKNEALRVLENDVEQRPDNVGSLVSLARMRIKALQGVANASNKDALAAAWQSRRELQLALSRLPTYLDTASSSVVPLPGSPETPDTTGITPPAPAPANDLAVDQRRPEDELKREIERLMSDADARIERLTAASPLAH